MAPAEGVQEGILRLTGEHHWTYEGEMVGACGYYLAREDVDGIIAMAAFGCGPDSVMLDIMHRETSKAKKPFMSLIVDEHSAEAGLVTRLEAFMDMLERQKRGQG
jgi:predicted nucleotide-binding protein (sugar kinase/HSP70/actin superfamily)